MLTALVEILHNHANKHVEDEEANNKEEGDEIQQHPRIVVCHRLGLELECWAPRCDVKEGGKKQNGDKREGGNRFSQIEMYDLHFGWGRYVFFL